MSTLIEWTDETWNPTVGCSRVSPGCDHCYAIDVAHRAMQPVHEGLTERHAAPTRQIGTDTGFVRTDWTGEVRLLRDRLEVPLHWKRSRRVFVDSMSDLFHADVPYTFIRDVFNTMRLCSGITRASDGYVYPSHTFQVLTKRPQRMAMLATDGSLGFNPDAPPSNVWLGTSVENQRYADLRIPHLLATPAAVRFLSIEPLLGPVDLRAWMRTPPDTRWQCSGCRHYFSGELRETCPDCGRVGYWSGSLDPNPIDWVIVGGESGPGARPMHPAWVRSIRDQCLEAGVPFLFKQVGAWGWGGTPSAPGDDWTHRLWLDGSMQLRTEPLGLRPPNWHGIKRVGKHAAGRELDGRTWDEYPA